LIATDSQYSVAAVGQAFNASVGLLTPAQNTLAVAVAVPPGPITVNVYVCEPVSVNEVVPLQLTAPTPLSTEQSPVVAFVVATVKLAVVPPVTVAVNDVIAVSEHTPGVPAQVHASAVPLHPQSVTDPHPHTPPVTHALPFAFPVQSVHRAPVAPQVVSSVPAVHVPAIAAEQHPPLHACPVPHAVVQRCVVVSQALPVGQSVATLHPQFAPMHLSPFAFPVQSLQVPATDPHDAGCVSSAAHVPALVQHVPLHGFASEHAVEHVFGVPAPLHALSVGQSLCDAHPHVPPPVTASQVIPTLLFTHVAHAPPVDPHAACAVPPTHRFDVVSQHPPLHVSPPAQLVPQVWLVVLQASPVAQSADVLHPQAFATHAFPAAFPLQATHALPAAPQVATAVSIDAHVPLLQHVPLHGALVEQVDVHVVGVPAPLHALSVGQSVAEAHPHAPPPVTATHAVPPPLLAQDMHAPPVAPHTPCAVPPTHTPLVSQHPPLQVSPPVQLVPQVWFVVLHACPVGQSFDVLHPQASVERHTGVSVPVHTLHAPPPVPHAPSPVPATHTPLVLQHPPLHSALGEHAVWQVCVPVSHATPDPQSVDAVLHPQVPPFAPAMHAVPVELGGVPSQSRHVPPLSPHAAATRPVVHVPDDPQHPPLHACEGEQLAVQVLCVTSHAIPTGQSLALAHPHAPLTHAAPASAATQFWQMLPLAPHAVAVSGAAQVVPVQQTPLHGWVWLQAVTHPWLEVSHACPVGHWLVAVHPASGTKVSAAPVSPITSAPVSATLESLASSPGRVESTALSPGALPSTPIGPSAPASSPDPASMSDRSKLTSSSHPVVVKAAITSAATRSKARLRSVIPSSERVRKKDQNLINAPAPAPCAVTIGDGSIENGSVSFFASFFRGVADAVTAAAAGATSSRERRRTRLVTPSVIATPNDMSAMRAWFSPVSAVAVVGSLL
jgi:hypothetical protein